MTIQNCMKRRVISIHRSATIGQAASLICNERIGTLPVVNDAGALIGVVRMVDLLDLVMPDFIKFIEDFDFVHDFGVLETRKPSGETLSRSVTEIMVEPVAVHENSGLLRTAAIMYRQGLNDMLVVSSDGKLVGIASRVDIGIALLSSWTLPMISET